MKKVDFVFSYEVKARELESVCMIKQEMERRGYTTAVLNTWQAIHRKPLDLMAEVLVLSACYRTSTLNSFASNIRHYHKAVNLQWEQIRSTEAEREIPEDITKSNYYYSGKALQAVHISWGQKNADHLIQNCAIPERNVVLAGHPTLDYLRPELRSYYLTREELFSKYDLPSEKKAALFISSFSLVGIPESELALGKSFGDHTIDEKTILFSRSQAEILRWFRSALEKTDMVFIYRPHPAEANNPALKALEAEYENFRVIKDGPVKQWILACDVIYNWNSTSLAEVYMCGKSCYMLRPLPLPDSANASIFDGVEGIQTEADFLKSLEDPNPAFPISEERLRYYYYIPEEKCTYQLICDALERVYHDRSYQINGWKDYYRRDKIVRRFWDDLASSRLGAKLAGMKRLPSVFRKVQNKIISRRTTLENPEKGLSDYTIEMRRLNGASPEEIEAMCAKLRQLTQASGL